MLTPTYLSNAAEPLVELWSQVESDIIADIAARLVRADYATPTAKWQIYKAKQLGMSQSEITTAVAGTTGKSKALVKQFVSDACDEALQVDTALYKSAGLDTAVLTSSKAMKSIVAAGREQTGALMKNFTRTTANTATKAFENSLDRIWLQVQSGAFSVNTAISRAITALGKHGITQIAYPGGHKDQVDVAVRRATVTGLNQTACNLQLQAAALMKCDLVEVTRHAGARPSHALWQGGIYSLSGKSKKYKPFRATTGYGTGEGLGGWNCRHNFYPYIEGLSSPTFDKDPNQALGKSNDQVYEESQRQRALERKVRESKRECAALDAARKAASDDETKTALNAQFEIAAAKLKARTNRLDLFCNETARTKEVDRLSVLGYNRSVSSKAVAASKRHYTQWAGSLGIREVLPTINDYYQLKNSRSVEYSWLRGYVKAVEKGEVSSLIGFSNYRDTAKAITKQLVGIETSDGVEIKGFTTHFIDRVIEQVAQPHPGKREGVTIDKVKEALAAADISSSVSKSGKVSRKYRGSSCFVTLNPDTGKLIQTNPRGGKGIDKTNR